MSVVTISRELGSEGSLVAEKAARSLGYHLADESTIETMLRGYGIVEFDQEYRSIPGFWDSFSSEKTEERDAFLNMLNRSLQALANHGDVVIVGRGGFAILEGMPGVLNVRIQAPLSLRIERAEAFDAAPAAEEPRQAERLVTGNDRIQKEFVKSVYGMSWDAADAFDLVIDTGKIAPDLAASMIARAARALPAPDSGSAAFVPEFQVDDVLASAVQDVLDCKRKHSAREKTCC
jgi:cytidylate kinase